MTSILANLSFPQHCCPVSFEPRFAFFLMMSFPSCANSNKDTTVKPSAPIAIDPSNLRRRSDSVSSYSSSSASSQSELMTPMSTSMNHQRILIPSSSTSPILSYFLAQSPTKTPSTATFPFKRQFGPAPMFEGEQYSCTSPRLVLIIFTEERESQVPVTGHTRRASSAVAGRFSSQQQNVALVDGNSERGSNLLRRLSLSSPFVKVSPLLSLAPVHTTLGIVAYTGHCIASGWATLILSSFPTSEQCNQPHFCEHPGWANHEARGYH